MALLNDLKRLLLTSRLFVDDHSAAANAASLAHPSADDPSNHNHKNWEKGRKRRRGKDSTGDIKLGQGGTLDPLADGVLGAFFFPFTLALHFVL